MLSFFAGRGWNDPDWRVRERAALSMSDRNRLRHLALADVAEEVRIAAVKGIGDEVVLAQIVNEGACEASRRLALARVKDAERRFTFVVNTTLPVSLRIFALESLPADPRLRDCYAAEAEPAFKIALLRRINDDHFLRDVARGDSDRAARVEAIAQLRGEDLRVELALAEGDEELRRLLITGVTGAVALRELFANEDDEAMRVWMVAHIKDQAHLAELAQGDHNAEVRAAAVGKLTDTEALITIACGEAYEKICLLALGRLGTDPARAAVALGSAHEAVRIEALAVVESASVVAQIGEQAAHPEMRWLAGRRQGEYPVGELRELRRGRTLKRVIDREALPEVGAWLVRHVADTEALRVLAGSAVPAVSAAATMRLRESVGPHELRLMTVPGRPYELGVFPVTRAQLCAVLGEREGGEGEAGDDEAPATGMTPETAQEFCARLSAIDGATYRLPSFEEWRHACITDKDMWFADPGPKASGEERGLHTQRISLGAAGLRPIWRAWPNPWGLLDMLGNVAVWVDDSTEFLVQNAPLLASDPLASGGVAGDAAGFGYAAGATWADARVRKGRLERLVARAALKGYAADKVGFRVLRENSKTGGPLLKFKLVLLPETAGVGISQADVVAALRGRWLEARERAEVWYKVAPTVVMTSASYPEIRRYKLLLEQCGARVRLSS